MTGPPTYPLEYLLSSWAALQRLSLKGAASPPSAKTLPTSILIAHSYFTPDQTKMALQSPHVAMWALKSCHLNGISDFWQSIRDREVLQLEVFAGGHLVETCRAGGWWWWTAMLLFAFLCIWLLFACNPRAELQIATYNICVPIQSFLRLWNFRFCYNTGDNLPLEDCSFSVGIHWSSRCIQLKSALDR